MSSSYYLIILLLIGTDANIRQPALRIMGGWEVLPGEIPYQVSLSLASDGFHICGGVIYNDFHIITAASCLIYYEEPIVVTAGSVVRGNSIQAITRNVVNHTIHPSYNHTTLMFDIAILKLNKSLDIKNTNTISTIELQKNDVKEGTLCNVSGWGRTDQISDASMTLKAVEVAIVSQQECISKYHLDEIQPKFENIICTGFYTNACKGDGGGPLVCNGTLTGIVSAGTECGDPWYPVINTRISSLYDWIKKNDAVSVVIKPVVIYLNLVVCFFFYFNFNFI